MLEQACEQPLKIQKKTLSLSLCSTLCHPLKNFSDRRQCQNKMLIKLKTRRANLRWRSLLFEPKSGHWLDRRCRRIYNPQRRRSAGQRMLAKTSWADDKLVSLDGERNQRQELLWTDSTTDWVDPIESCGRGKRDTQIRIERLTVTIEWRRLGLKEVAATKREKSFEQATWKVA